MGVFRQLLMLAYVFLFSLSQHTTRWITINISSINSNSTHFFPFCHTRLSFISCFFLWKGWGNFFLFFQCLMMLCRLIRIGNSGDKFIVEAIQTLNLSYPKANNQPFFIFFTLIHSNKRDNKSFHFMKLDLVSLK